MGLRFISSGLPAMVSDFVQQFGLDERSVWVDPSRRTYQALRFRRGPWTVLSPAVFANARRAGNKGFRQGATQGDAWQQGGVLVARKGGAPEYFFASEVAGDHPPVAVVLEHAKRAAGR